MMITSENSQEEMFAALASIKKRKRKKKERNFELCMTNAWSALTRCCLEGAPCSFGCAKSSHNAGPDHITIVPGVSRMGHYRLEYRPNAPVTCMIKTPVLCKLFHPRCLQS